MANAAKSPRSRSTKYPGAIAARARKIVRAQLPAPCTRCGGLVDLDDAWEADHRPSKQFLPQEEWDNPDYLFPAHKRCNRSAGASEGNRTRGKGVRPATVTPLPRRTAGGIDLSGLQEGAEALAATGLLDGAPGAYPRLWSPSLDGTVGTYATAERLDELDAVLESIGLYPMRPWQRLVLARAYEHRADGSLTARHVLCIAPRGSGKSILLTAFAVFRLLVAAEVFPGKQRVLHTSRRLSNVLDIQSTLWPWADDAEGVKVRRRAGSEAILWANGNSWEALVVANAAGRHGAGLVLVDELWDHDLVQLQRYLAPTQVTAPLAQTVYLSTPSPDQSDAIQRLRQRAAKPGSATILCEWSLPQLPVGRTLTVDDFKPCSPHWDQAREDHIADLLELGETADNLATQWACAQPGGDAQVAKPWPPGWQVCRVAPTGPPPTGSTVAIETSLDESLFAVVSAAMDGEYVDIRHAQFATLEDAVAAARSLRPGGAVLAGASIASMVTALGLDAEAVGSAEIRSGSATLASAVERGIVRHQHDPLLDEQVLAAVTHPDDSGNPVLSSRRSGKPTPGVRAVLFAAVRALSDSWAPSPMIW